MKHASVVKVRAINLRKKGYSLQEISHVLEISKSTVSLWVRGLKLDFVAQKRLETLKVKAKMMAEKRWDKYRNTRNLEVEKIAKKVVAGTNLSQDNNQIYLAILFWTEGSKNLGNVSFMNSDPVMISLFIKLLRLSFPLDESKFRVLLHLHEYHDETIMKRYWSGVTNVPLDQFSKTYIKPHTKSRIHPNYKGCCKVKYHDTRIARILSAIYNSLAMRIGV